MTISLNVIVQMMGVAIQALNQIAPFFPPKTKVTIAASIALLQAIVAFLAHFKNPVTYWFHIAQVTPLGLIKAPRQA